ncbi:hypothetical protein GCM10027563_10820 [Parasphingorhabdus pacifica]
MVRSFDDAEAASAVLSRAVDWEPDSPAVLRHHLRIPQAELDTARRLLEPDDWAVTLCDIDPDLQKEEVSVLAYRIQKLDSLHCSQEGSRMAGLAQRLNGRALGWDALQRGDEVESN